MNRQDELNAMLIDATTYGRPTELVEKLLGDGADPHARDRRDRTPLLCALAVGGFKTVQLLLDRGTETAETA
jgi:ankyrin repeat protein